MTTLSATLVRPIATGERFSYNVSRTERGYEVEVPVPGFGPENIEITLKDELLTIAGTTEKRSFTRNLVVNDEIDPEGISAKVEHGLLTISLNRRPEVQPRKISVN
jgi:HSP20 family protein